MPFIPFLDTFIQSTPTVQILCMVSAWELNLLPRQHEWQTTVDATTITRMCILQRRWLPDRALPCVKVKRGAAQPRRDHSDDGWMLKWKRKGHSHDLRWRREALLVFLDWTLQHSFHPFLYFPFFSRTSRAILIPTDFSPVQPSCSRHGSTREVEVKLRWYSRVRKNKESVKAGLW